MAENNCNQSCDLSQIRESVCVHTGKIVDSCLDKDCIEDLRVYLTEDSQAALDQSTSTRARCAELLNIRLNVHPVTFNRGYYAVDITYYYKIIADAVINCTKPVSIYGLAVFAKRVVLCGGESATQVFSSKQAPDCCCGMRSLPEAIIEAVDPMLLSARVLDSCDNPRCPCEVADIPACIRDCFDSPLITSGESRRLFVTLGQFSVVRLERDAQLLVPCFDYCIPDKECTDLSGCDESPCDVFDRIDFPMDAFYPGSACSSPNCGCSCDN